MNDETTYSVSPGVLVAPFGESAVAVDLIEEQTHVLGPAAAWLLSQDSPVQIVMLVEGAPEAERATLRGEILDALDALRSAGLVDRAAPYDAPLAPAVPGGPTPGGHVGQTHAVIDRRIAFRSDDAALLERIDHSLGEGVDTPAALFFDVVKTEEGFTLYAPDVWQFASEERMIRQLPVVLNDDGARTHGMVVIHAGTVRTPDGRTIVLTGPSNAGKSTLTAALVAAGCDYLGDESVGVGSDGSVYGYPKPLTLSSASREALGLEHVTTPHVRVDAIRSEARGLVSSPGVDQVLLVAYDPEYDGPLFGEPLAASAALEAVLENVLNLARAGEHGLDMICRLVETTPVIPLTRADLDTAVSRILTANQASVNLT